MNRAVETDTRRSHKPAQSRREDRRRGIITHPDAKPPKDATTKERAWFPKQESVAIGILGYLCEPGASYTLEDIVAQMGCNCVSAAGSLWQLRRVGYVATKRDADRIIHEHNAKWGRNVLHVTARGRSRYEKHEEEQREQATEAESARH